MATFKHWPWRDESLDDVFDQDETVWVGPSPSGQGVRVLVGDILELDRENEDADQMFDVAPLDLTVNQARHLRDALDRAIRRVR